MIDKKRELRVLILDENETYLSAIRACATMNPPEFGLTFQFAASEDSARRIINEWDPSCVLLDAHIPEFDACGALERYMAEVVPVIITSDSASRDIEASALSRGAVKYITKSENPDEIESLLCSIGEVSIEFDSKH